MALLFMDSFDHYATADLTTKWTSNLFGGGVNTSIAAGGRRGSGSFRVAPLSFPTHNQPGGLQKVLAPGNAGGTVGLAFVASSASMVGASGMAIVSLRDAAAPQVTLRLNPTLTLSVLCGTSGGTLLGTTAVALSAGVMAYLELKVIIHPSAGTVDVRINGVSVLSLTGQNTRNTANTSWNGLALGPVDISNNIWNPGTSSGPTFDWDDLYVLDTAGAAPWNTFLGDCRVDARLPTGAGGLTQWTPSTGANWQNVDDATPNGDTDYNSAASSPLTDTFATQDAPVPGAAIYGVQVNLTAKKSDAGPCSIAAVVRQAGANQVGAALNPSTAYTDLLQVWPTNPHTSAAWVEADFNADEFGYQRTA